MVVEGQLLVVGAALSHVIASISSCSNIHALVYLSGTSVVYICILRIKAIETFLLSPFYTSQPCVCVCVCCSSRIK